ncbi:hypothetical protein [Myxococcus stipitatus]|nr:hypothetical protein [Myxococcus stipitatus]
MAGWLGTADSAPGIRDGMPHRTTTPTISRDAATYHVCLHSQWFATDSHA